MVDHPTNDDSKEDSFNQHTCIISLFPIHHHQTKPNQTGISTYLWCHVPSRSSLDHACVCVFVCVLPRHSRSQWLDGVVL